MRWQNASTHHTDSKEAERRLRTQYATTRVLAEAVSLNEAIPQILQAICETLEWDFSTFWVVTPDRAELQCFQTWMTPSFAGAEFESVTRQSVFGLDQSLPGRVWVSGSPVCIPDVGLDDQFRRAALAVRVGLHGAYAFPVRSGHGVLGVVEFFSRTVVEPDDMLLAMISSIGSQIGLFMERQRAEEGLRLRDRAIEASMQGIVITDPSLPDNPIVYMNPAFERMTGYSRAEVINRNCRFLQGPKTDPAAVNEVRAAIREERSCLVELLNYRKDGTTFWNALSIAPLHEAGRVTHFLAVQTDVTPFKRLEEQLRQTQKMEAIGQLAGGVAHDFNNLLTVINGYSDLLISHLAQDEMAKELLQEIRGAGERAASLTRQLLAFSRKQMLEPRVLDLNDVVGSMDRMLQRLIGEDVRLTAVLAAKLPSVKVDPGQMEQVVMNLVVNARDAMPTGGQVTLETSVVELDEWYAAAHAEVKPGRYVLLTVSDTGCGMTPEVRTRLFEPFFTTKEAGKGTGLGLAMVYGIIKQSNGHIAVYSEPGRGTSFKVYLPIVEEAVRPLRTAQANLKQTPQGNETVLLVEDEYSVRAMTRFALQTFGYTVLETSAGAEALQVAESYDGPIHLLMTDVVMPGMGGPQVAQEVLRLRPDVRVLYLSGYTDDAVFRHGVLEAEVNFLQKPFPLAVLAEKVRAVLER